MKHEMTQVEGRELQIPERKLAAAVLVRAIRDFMGWTHSENGICNMTNLRRDATKWILSKATAEVAFSFAWCCEAVGFEPDKMKLCLQEAKQSPEALVDYMSRFGPANPNSLHRIKHYDQLPH